MSVEHHKIVRDRIPEIIEAAGGSATVRVLSQQEARAALLAKLGEETVELAQAAGDEVLGELADLLEVVRALAVEHGITWDRLTCAAEAKAQARGRFARRLFLISVEQAAG